MSITTGYFNRLTPIKSTGLSGGIDKRMKTLPKEYGIQPDVQLPKLTMTSPQPVSKATKFAADFVRQQKKMQLEDEHAEALARQTGGIVPPSLQLVQKVQVVNMPNLAQTVSSGVNLGAGITAAPSDGAGFGRPGGSRRPPRPPQPARNPAPLVPTQVQFPVNLPTVRPSRGGEPVVTRNPLTQNITLTDSKTIHEVGEEMAGAPSGLKRDISSVPDFAPTNPAREIISTVVTAPHELIRSQVEQKMTIPRIDRKPPKINTRVPQTGQNMEGLLPTTLPRPQFGNHPRDEMWSFLDTPQIPLAARDAAGWYAMDIDTSPLSSIASMRTASPLAKTPISDMPQVGNIVKNTPQQLMVSSPAKRPFAINDAPNKRMRMNPDPRANPLLSDVSYGVHKRLRGEYSGIIPIVDDNMTLRNRTAAPVSLRSAPPAGAVKNGKKAAASSLSIVPNLDTFIGVAPRGDFESVEIPLTKVKRGKDKGKSKAVAETARAPQNTFLGVEIPVTTKKRVKSEVARAPQGTFAGVEIPVTNARRGGLVPLSPVRDEPIASRTRSIKKK